MGTCGHSRAESILSPLRGGLRKAGSVIFLSWSRAKEWEHLGSQRCSGCGSGHSLVGRGMRQLESCCMEEALADQLRMEPLTTSPQETGSPGQAESKERAWGLGTGDLLHQLCVLKGWGRPWPHSCGLGGHRSLSPDPRTQATSLPSAFGDRPVGASLSSSPSLSIRAAGSMETIWSPIPPLTPSSLLCMFLKIKIYFLKKVIYFQSLKPKCSKKPHPERHHFYLSLHPLCPQLLTPPGPGDCSTGFTGALPLFLLLHSV